MTGDPLGIDLGTTYSVVAQAGPDGRVEVLTNEIGEIVVPSVVHFESPDSVLVGTAARNASPLRPEHTVRLVKRLMGTDRSLEFFGEFYSPELISSLILRALVQGVGRRDRVPAVVTVPAYFGTREREATQQACLLAGIEPLELVSEPVAAAIHYGLSDAGADGLAVVYDLGGGTFDTTLLSLGEVITPIATDGDVELGGADWDQRLADYLVARFMEATGAAESPAEDPMFQADLVFIAERVKRDLSQTMTQHVPLRHRGRAVGVPLSRAEFESMTADLVGSTVSRVHRLLDRGGRTAAQVDEVILVGGSSRMPMISKALTDEFGWRPRLYDPDLAVAKGAALRAHRLSGRRNGSVALRAPDRADAASVVPRALGLLVEDSDDPTATRSFVQQVIHQNERLPIVDRPAALATILPSQRKIKISVYEQAGSVQSPDVEHNRPVLEGELTGLPAGLPAGSRIVLLLSLGLDGRLQVTATEPRTGTSLMLEAFVEGVIDSAARSQAAARLTGLTVRM